MECVSWPCCMCLGPENMALDHESSCSGLKKSLLDHDFLRSFGPLRKFTKKIKKRRDFTEMMPTIWKRELWLNKVVPSLWPRGGSRIHRGLLDMYFNWIQNPFFWVPNWFPSTETLPKTINTPLRFPIWEEAFKNQISTEALKFPSSQLRPIS